jgi:nucleoside-diphosphate-sugar epimerase
MGFDQLTYREDSALVEPGVRGTGTPPGEIERRWVDTRKLRAMSGWAPLIGLEEALRRMVDWYHEHVHGRR